MIFDLHEIPEITEKCWIKFNASYIKIIIS